MNIRANVKAGRPVPLNHNEKLSGDKKSKSLTVKTGIKAGSLKENIDPAFIRR